MHISGYMYLLILTAACEYCSLMELRLEKASEIPDVTQQDSHPLLILMVVVLILMLWLFSITHTHIHTHTHTPLNVFELL